VLRVLPQHLNHRLERKLQRVMGMRRGGAVSGGVIQTQREQGWACS